MRQRPVTSGLSDAVVPVPMLDEAAARKASLRTQRWAIYGCCGIVALLVLLLQREAIREQQDLEQRNLLTFKELEQTVPNAHLLWTSRNPMLVNPNGQIGTGLCYFGRTVLDLVEQFGTGARAWRKICHIDSDNDGTTNGEELGDPCCEWNLNGAAPVPYRVWNLTHPGRGQENFTEKGLKAVGPEACGAPWTKAAEDRRHAQFLRFYYGFHASDLESSDALFWLKIPLLGVMAWLLWGWAKTGGLCRDLFGFGPCARLGDGIDLTRLQRAQVIIASYFWTDGVAGLTHLTFDFCPHYFPIVGSVAKGFQFHHHHPTAWVVVPFFQLMSHSVPLLGVLSVIFLVVRPRRALRLFWATTYILCFTTALTHRWCHVEPEQLPLWFRGLQDLGLLMTHQHHQAHHLSLITQFSNLSGVTDFILDFATRHFVPAHLYQHWASITLLYFLAPIVCGSEALRAATEAQHHKKLERDVSPSE